MDWTGLNAVLLMITFASIAQTCAGNSKEGPPTELLSSKCFSPPPDPNEPSRIAGLGLDDRTTTFYNFCNTTYHALGVYSTQIVLKNIRKKYGEKDINHENVLSILSEAGITIPYEIRTNWGFGFGTETKYYLVDLVRKQIPYIHFKLNKLNVIDETRNKRSCLGIDVFGRNVILSDVMDLYMENVHRETDCTLCRFCNWELRILATGKFYIDRQVEGRFVETDTYERLKYMSVVAPVWEVQAEAGETRSIKLDGERTSMEGGFFIGVYSKITDAGKLFISANGADNDSKYDGGNSGSIHLVNTSGKVTVHNEACPGSGKYDGKFTKSLYMPGHVVGDMHAEMINLSLFNCFSSEFDDFFIQLDSQVQFTINPLSLAKELEIIEHSLYGEVEEAIGDRIYNCPWKIKRRMTTYYEKTLERTLKQLENPAPADKRTLGIIASLVLSKLISNWKLDRTPIGYSTKLYLRDVGKELNWLIETFESTDIEEGMKLEMAVTKEKVSKTMLHAKVHEAEDFMNNRIRPTSIMVEDSMNTTSDKILKSLKTFLEADQNDLLEVEKLKEDFEDLIPFKYIFSGLQVVGTVIGFFGPGGANSGTPGGSLIAGGSILGVFLEDDILDSHPSAPTNNKLHDESVEYGDERLDSLPLPMVDDDEENDTDYLSLIPQAKDAVEDLLGKIKSNNLTRAQLESAIQTSKAKTNGFMLFIKRFYNTFIPPLKQMAREIRKELTITNGTSRSVLAVKKWNIRNVLNNMRNYLRHFAEWISEAENKLVKPGGEITGKSKEFETLQFSLESLGEALEGIFELYGQIGMYQEWKQLAKVIVIANTPNIDEDSEDFDGEIILERLLKLFITNLALQKHNKALHAFKQWVFPFAKNYIEDYRYLIPDIPPNKTFAKIFNSCKNAIDGIGNLLERDMPWKSKFHWFKDYSLFTSAEIYYKPFYVWKNDKWQHAIRRLLQGEEIRVKADVDMIGHDEATKNFFRRRTAIKFIGIEVVLKAHDESLQDELNDALDYFEMKMTHSGLSIYKVNGQHFVMRNDPQYFHYYFQDGASLHNVDGFKEGINSDFLLSPYTWWTFCIREANSIKDFEKLQKFANKVDLELHGSGTFLDERDANNGDPAFLNDLKLEEYYEIYQPNNYEMLNVGEIQTNGGQRSCSSQAVVSSVNQEKCYHKLKCAEGKGGVTITGKFQLISDPDNDDFADYLNSTGYSEDFRSEFRSSNMVNISLNMLNSTTYCVETLIDDKKNGMCFKSGNEFKTLLGDSRKVSNIINVNAEQKLVTRIIKFTDFEATNELIFCYWGFKAALKAKNAEAVLTFRRLSDPV